MYLKQVAPLFDKAGIRADLMSKLNKRIKILSNENVGHFPVYVFAALLPWLSFTHFFFPIKISLHLSPATFNKSNNTQKRDLPDKN